MITSYLSFFVSAMASLITNFYSLEIPGTGVSLAGFLLAVFCMGLLIHALLLRVR